MKKIFDWMREQVNGLKHDNPMVTSNYILREDALSIINEAESKWESDVCEWKPSEYYTYSIIPIHHKNCMGMNRLYLKDYPYCSRCGKPIKIVEVE